MTRTSGKNLEEIARQAQLLAPKQRLAYIRDACAKELPMDEFTKQGIRSQDDWGDLNSGDWEANEVQTYEYGPGERIGPYRVLHLLGEGGMGAVFLAERADDQFRQQVAIKLVRRGLLSRSVQSRLRIERQILASLDHPNISKLLDGGTTAAGTPYIVMEYVDGQPIDTYCDEHELTIEERLQLFRTVCSAVHCAHQNLVVHRDLKPSNILVTRDGIPKLLDFGIAKLLDERHLQQTLAVTHADLRLMTPDHASPEQVRGDAITTASDTYVLAVLLYELLTGYKPFTLKSNRLAELENAICEQPPLSLSDVFAHAMRTDATEMHRIAESRRTIPSKMRRQLRGDLNNIVLMALRKEPERRYSSVEQFSADIDRCLRGLPVMARTDAWAYRASKFVRRHFIVVCLSAAFIASTIGFSVTTHVQSQRIAQERDVAAEQRSVAELQRSRAESVSSFMVELFRVSDPSEARGNEVKAREILDRGAARIRTELKNQPELQSTLMETIGLVYLSLGLTDQAEPMLQQSLSVRRSLFGYDNELVAQSLTGLAEVYRDQGNLNKAEELTEESLAISRKLTGADSLATAKALRNLAMVRFSQGDLNTAKSLLNSSLNIYTKRLGDKNTEIATVLGMLGRIEEIRGNYSNSEQLLRQALTIQRSNLGDEHPQYILQLHNLATVLQSKGDLNAAEAMFRDAVARYERILGPSPDMAAAISNLASLLQQKGNFDEAHKLYESSLSLKRQFRGEHHYLVGYDLVNLGRLSMSQHKLAEAEHYFRDALTVYRASPPENHQYTAGALTMLGRLLVARNRPAEAEPFLTEALETWQEQLGMQSDSYALTNASLARVFSLQGRLTDAEKAFRLSYPTLITTRGADAEATVQVRGWIEDLFHSQKRSKELAGFLAAAQDKAKSAQTQPK